MGDDAELELVPVVIDMVLEAVSARDWKAIRVVNSLCVALVARRGLAGSALGDPPIERGLPCITVIPSGRYKSSRVADRVGPLCERVAGVARSRSVARTGDESVEARYDDEEDDDDDDDDWLILRFPSPDGTLGLTV